MPPVFMRCSMGSLGCGIRASKEDLHYLVMELVPGGDLEKLVCRGGPAPIARAC